MRVLFLDIDGVLNKLGCKVMTPSNYYFVEDDKILLLKELVDKTGAKIVLSSTWRQGWQDLNDNKHTSHSEDFLLLKNKLEEFGLEFIDYTPLSEEGYRGKEIYEWIENHLEEIDSVLILDDNNDINPLGHFFLRTSFTTGLKQTHVNKGVTMLERDDFKEWYNKKKSS